MPGKATVCAKYWMRSSRSGEKVSIRASPDCVRSGRSWICACGSFLFASPFPFVGGSQIGYQMATFYGVRVVDLVASLRYSRSAFLDDHGAYLAPFAECRTADPDFLECTVGDIKITVLPNRYFTVMNVVVAGELFMHLETPYPPTADSLVEFVFGLVSRRGEMVRSSISEFEVECCQELLRRVDARSVSCDEAVMRAVGLFGSQAFGGKNQFARFSEMGSHVES